LRSWGGPESVGSAPPRFVPRDKAVGCLGVVVGILLLVQSVAILSSGHRSGLSVALEVVVGVLGVAQLIRSIDGLREMERRGCVFRSRPAVVGCGCGQ
jgi:hypothetical protein